MDFISNLLTILDNYVSFTYFDAIDMINSGTDVNLFKSNQILLSPFTCIDQYNREGQQPLHYAILGGNPVAWDWILSEPDVKINAITEIEEWNPAHLAVKAGSPDLLTRLIGLGVDMNALDARKLTPLAYTETDLESQKWIQLTQLNFKIPLGPLDRNYFHYFSRDATLNLLNHSIQSAQELIDKPDKTGTTALMLAAEDGQEVSLQRLLQAGAQINVFDFEGRTALHRAAAAGQSRSCQLLLRFDDADNDYFDEQDDDFITDLVDYSSSSSQQFISDKRGLTPLMSAVLNGHLETVKVLAKRNSKHLDLRNEITTGDTALHYAVLIHSPQIVSVLLEAGAFADAVNKDGKKPLDLVSEAARDQYEDLFIVAC